LKRHLRRFGLSIGTYYLGLREAGLDHTAAVQITSSMVMALVSSHGRG
jgi:hypothetical protein